MKFCDPVIEFITNSGESVQRWIIIPNTNLLWDEYVTNCFVPITTSSGCELNDNACVCTTSSFVIQVATCLGKECPIDVHTTYVAFKSNCATYGGYSLALNMTQFLIDGGALSSYLSTAFWATYPECAITNCLTPLTAASGCEIDNNDYCTSTDIGSVYTSYSGACASNGGYPIALSESQWLFAAGARTGFGTSSGTVSASSTTMIEYTSVLASASSTLPKTTTISTNRVFSPISTTTSTTVTDAGGSSTSSTSSTLAPTATNTTTTSSSTSSGGLSNRAIAGITVGGFIVTLLALWAAWTQIQVALAQLRHAGTVTTAWEEPCHEGARIGSGAGDKTRKL
ncbi:hypothetical protein NA56DRAFT_744198 [Hyaloscypha hepaticicola]|uniref:CFEM domain-containing protein n=1 Tax=Hyaloscypha hepaticicola TaxID=2082293 RepID=A0A2J6QKV0_9HELO|nr:hypothetical protein NA56DRAFT_744198 [Hyaloscypha hepaticicola]